MAGKSARAYVLIRLSCAESTVNNTTPYRTVQRETEMLPAAVPLSLYAHNVQPPGTPTDQPTNYSRCHIVQIYRIAARNAIALWIYKTPNKAVKKTWPVLTSRFWKFWPEILGRWTHRECKALMNDPLFSFTNNFFSSLDIRPYSRKRNRRHHPWKHGHSWCAHLLKDAG